MKRSDGKRRITKWDLRSIPVLVILIALTCVFVFRDYIFGGKLFIFYDIGSDTLQQYVAKYIAMSRHLGEGNFSTWIAEYGFGAGATVMNPFNFVLLILNIVGAAAGKWIIPEALVYMFMAEILLSGILVYLYLSVFSFGERAKVIASYMFAFNGFMIVWGQHYQFGAICIFLPLILWAIERAIRSRSFKLLVLASFLTVISSMYVAYMIFLLCAFYVIVRTIMLCPGTVGGYFKKVFKCAGSMILGILMGAFSLLPSIQTVMNVSGRMEHTSTFAERLSWGLYMHGDDYFMTMLSRMFSSTVKGINEEYVGPANYYEDVHLFFSTLFIFLLILYLFNIVNLVKGNKNRIIQYLLVVLAVASVTFSMTGVIMNAVSGTSTRYTFIYLPWFALISAAALDGIFRGIIRFKWLLFVGMAGCLAVYGFYFYAGNYENYNLVILAVTGILMGVVLLFAGPEKKGRSIAMTLLLGLLLIVNVSSDTDSNFIDRTVPDKNGKFIEEMSDSETASAIKWIKANDKNTYRIEKMYGATESMDAMVYGYRSVSSYNSTQNGYIQKYVKSRWPELLKYPANEYYHAFSAGSGNLNESRLAGVKYVLARDEEVPENFTQIALVGTVKVYEDKEVKGIADFFAGKADAEKKMVYSDNDKDSKVTYYEGDSDSHLTFDVDAAKDGYLYVAVPYENGWSARVDGTTAYIKRANTGFSAVELSEGKHKVELYYVLPWIIPGVCCSVAFTALFIVICVLNRRKKRREV